MTSMIVLILACVYLAGGMITLFFQESFIFRPEKLDENFEFNHPIPSEEYDLPVSAGGRINGLRFRTPDDRSRGIVLYLKGNSRSIKGWGKYAADFTLHGYEVLMMDYRGFGKSRGRRSQQLLMHDVSDVYRALRTHVDPEHIIIYGRSLGCYFATYLAAQVAPKMLILEAPFYSMEHIIRRILPIYPIRQMLRYPFETYYWFRDVTCPTFLIHGQKDALVPRSHSVKLQKENPSIAQLFTITGGGHKNLNTFARYHEILHDILAGGAEGREQTITQA